MVVQLSTASSTWPRESKNSSSATEALALPVLERHGSEASRGGAEGELPSAAVEVEGSTETEGTGSGTPATGNERGVTAPKSAAVDDDDDDREMPELTLYA